MLNTTQQIFTLFYAIFWGVTVSAQSKWKAFHFTFFMRKCQVTLRIILSIILLNIIPILYFTKILMILNNCKSNILSPSLIFKGIIPAFAILGFYRIWISIIEFFPTLFYRIDDENGLYPSKDVEPTLESLNIPLDNNHIKSACMNLLFGLIYIIISYLVAI